jgi:hypothetical protein
MDTMFRNCTESQIEKNVHSVNHIYRKKCQQPQLLSIALHHSLLVDSHE